MKLAKVAWFLKDKCHGATHFVLQTNLDERLITVSRLAIIL